MDITKIVSVVLTLCCVLITAFLIPWLRKKYGQEKLVEIANQTQQIHYWVKFFVAAAEQMFPPEDGMTKKDYVTKMIAGKLEELGVTYDAGELNAIIESCVLELHSAIYDYVEEETLTENSENTELNN